MEYGLISLLVIQLGAVTGCLIAWMRIRTEIDRIKDRAITEQGLNTVLEARINPILFRIQEVEQGLISCEQVATKSAGDAAKAVKAAIDMEDWERRILSVQNSLAALKRHRMPKEEPEQITELIEAPQNGQEPEFTPPPLIRGRDMRTFGKSA
jgi:hypothetical protein